jgi:hypothetical protein
MLWSPMGWSIVVRSSRDAADSSVGVGYLASRSKRIGRAIMPRVWFQRIAWTTRAYRLEDIRSWINPNSAGWSGNGRPGGCGMWDGRAVRSCMVGAEGGLFTRLRRVGGIIGAHIKYATETCLGSNPHPVIWKFI